MAKIPLRSYVKDIENLIERGEIEQAIAHAKSILNSYPKHIATYRLLGKAYLESQRYSEAADILQRVLSVIPDDFVSQLGMSIIREDEGNMDAAIWHMERAYEVQPFNPAVQDELRRLYGRRDGSEPPKIRLTRGALIRMYTRGELYPQAIAETRAALAEDPQRFDLLVMLARLYNLSNLKVEAAEVCSTLISKLPYCLEANQILTEILPGTSRSEDAKKFQQRIFALDPYCAFISPTAPTSNQVPDQVVMVEQFVWDASMKVDGAPEWTRNIGVTWEEEPEEEALPDWINTLKPDTQQQAAIYYDEPSAEQEQVISTQSDSDDFVPDWMKEAGWTTTDRRADDIMAEIPDGEEGEIAPAEIPDWIQSIAPGDSSPISDDSGRNAWLDTLLTQESGTNGKQVESSALEETEAADSVDADLPDWLSGMVESDRETQLDTPDTEETGVAPDWVGGLETIGFEKDVALPGEVESEEAAPDWLSDLETGGQEQESIPSIKPETEDAVPDWLSGLVDSSVGSAEQSDEINQAGFEPSESFQAEWIQEEPGIEQPETGGEVPDWLSSLESGDSEPAAAPAEMPDWLHSLQPEISSSQEIPAEETIDTTEEKLPEVSAAWIRQDQTTEEQEVVEPPIDSIPEWLQGVGESQVLESSEKDFADWMMVEPSETPEELETETESAVQETPDWLASLETGTTDTLPENMVNPAAERETADQPQIDAANEMNLDDAMAWLESLAARQGADEATLSTAPEDRTEAPPAWLAASFSDESSALSDTEAVSEEPVWDEAAILASLDDTSPVRVRPQEIQSEPVEAVAAEQEAVAAEQEAVAAEQEAVAAEQEADAAQQEAVAAQLEAVAAEGDSGVEQDITLLEPEPQPAQPEPVAKAQVEEPEMAAPPDFTDLDAALAWLEGLAAKQGADEATLTTAPEDRLETPPSWVQQEAESAQEEKASVLEPLESEEETLPEWMQEVVSQSGEETALPAWLTESQEPDEDELAAPEAAQQQEQEVDVAETQTTSEHLQQPTLEKDLDEPETIPEAPEAAAAEPAVDLDDAFAWLESLAAKQGADEATLITRPENRQETAPEWVQKEQAAVVDEESSADFLASKEEIQLDDAEILLEGMPENEDPETANITEVPQGTSTGQQEFESEQEEGEMPDWLKSMEDQEAQVTSTMDWVPAEEAGTDLQTSTEEKTAKNEEALPDWLQAITEESEASKAAAADWNAPVEEEEGMMESPVLDSADLDISAAWAPEEALLQTATAETAADGSSASDSLEGAYQALDRGNIQAALEGYRQLIQDNRNLAEIIQHLRDSLYRYPVDIDIWQALGDAYAQNNQLQEALEAYTKAEDLLR